MKATITDVARESGVSIKTVSRVLNKEPSVAKATRQKVLDVVKKLHYSPNLAAKGLASSKSYLVALIYDGTASPYYISGIQEGAIEACREYGYHLVPEPLSISESSLTRIFSQVTKNDTKEGDTRSTNEAKSDILLEGVKQILMQLRVDGVVLTPPLSDSKEVIHLFRDMNIPVALIAPSKRKLAAHAVKMDDVKAARELTQFLLAQGHSSIGFIKGHAKHSAATLRYVGFCEAMEQAGVAVDRYNIMQGDFSFKSGVVAAEALLKDGEKRPSAIFASNDDMAAGVVSVALRSGLSVPGDLSVCGFDDTPLAKILYPQLTTIRQPIHAMGFEAVKLLIAPEFKSAPPSIRNLDFELIIRGST